MAVAVGSALNHLANLGQFVEIGQGHAHQREQIRWTRRAYMLDSQSLRIDLLTAARDDIRGQYDTYVSRLDTLMLLDTLLLPFALNTLQFSDEFVPQTEETCDYCIESRHPWLAVAWVWLVAIALILPFWSILMLLRCKMKLDRWLERTLSLLNRERRFMLAPNNSLPQPSQTTSSAGSGEDKPSDQQAGTEQAESLVRRLGNFILTYQDNFASMWSNECSTMVHIATYLLCTSAYVAISLTGFMFWIFLVNRRGMQQFCHVHFAALIILGLILPLFYVIWHWCFVQRTREEELLRLQRELAELQGGCGPTATAATAGAAISSRDALGSRGAYSSADSPLLRRASSSMSIGAPGSPAAAAADGMQADLLASDRPVRDLSRNELHAVPEQDGGAPVRRLSSLRRISEVVASPFGS